MTIKNTSAIILAAGFSTRMGTAKYGLELPGGKTFLSSLISRYADFGCVEIVAVLNQEGMDFLAQANDHLPGQFSAVLNPHPELGRFRSIRCGLEALKFSNPVFIHNIDNPCVNYDILQILCNHLAGYDFVKPAVQSRGGHPVLVSRKVVEAALNEKHDQTIFSEFLKQFSGKKVEVNDESILLNINTRNDLEDFLKGDG
jgi:molybdenum cofactor cytidylyltransferase